PLPDLTLMDIQLDDGLCFEIFESINIDIPVIFTTAYDEFVLKAFKVNSVDYLLKPIEEIPLSNAINKFKSLHYNNTVTNDLLKRLSKEINRGYKNRFLVKIGANYRSVQVTDICCFYILERATFIRTFSERDYSVDYSLDYIQKTLDPEVFFRINRRCIVNINAVTDITGYSSSRFEIRLNSRKPLDDLIVSRDKVTEFKKWIDR
ncbi:MAG: LytTR family DNA-binding domain-containing protein, partial [Bacteroidales bacterium]|nr:LytTR family DNA-binding domain-containing protein [Bacteroidales bacterium]